MAHKAVYPDTTLRPEPILNDWVKLYDYQSAAIDWMAARENANPTEHRGITGGLVCLSMGLGKTLTALEHSLRSQTDNSEIYPTLIVTSKTVMYEWKKEGIEKFYTNINALYFHKDFLGDSIDRITAADITSTYNLVITTYDQCLSASRKHAAHKLVCEYGQEGLHKDKVIAVHNRKKPRYQPHRKGPVNIYYIPWTRVICDESQRFANPKTYTYKAVMAIYADYRWCLTGTPIRNHDTDIWSQLRYTGYNTITAARHWRRQMFRRQALAQYLYEADYDEANVDMPEQIIHHHTVELDPRQKATYKALLIQTKDLYERMLMRMVNFASVLAIFTRLRQVCIAPYLTALPKKNAPLVQEGIDLAIKKTKVEKWINRRDGTAGVQSPKIQKIVEIIDAVPPGEKIILFSMFTSCLKLLERAFQLGLEDRTWEYLDGSTTGQERMDILTNFKEDPDVTILLVHYKVGGEGLNLTEANHVICIEPWWSPAVHNQGIARCWRRGQQKPVNVHWVTTEHTIETPILKMCENKEKLANHYLHDTEYDPKPPGLTKYELQRLLAEAE